MSNIGRKIKDAYCNNFFTTSNNYDLEDATIESESADYIVVRKTDGKPSYANFDTPAEKQSYIKDWCTKTEED